MKFQQLNLGAQSLRRSAYLGEPFEISTFRFRTFGIT